MGKLIKNFKPEQTINYNDGRPGHNVNAEVVEVFARGMKVQFEDRMSPTTIFFTESEWMNFITIVNA